MGLVWFLRSFWFSDADGGVVARKAALREEDFLSFFSSFLIGLSWVSNRIAWTRVSPMKPSLLRQN